jgi:hypothetical protein
MVMATQNVEEQLRLCSRPLNNTNKSVANRPLVAVHGLELELHSRRLHANDAAVQEIGFA